MARRLGAVRGRAGVADVDADSELRWRGAVRAPGAVPTRTRAPRPGRCRLLEDEAARRAASARDARGHVRTGRCRGRPDDRAGPRLPIAMDMGARHGWVRGGSVVCGAPSD